MSADSFVGGGLTPSPYKLVKAELEAEKETIAVVHLRDPKDIRRIEDLEDYVEDLENYVRQLEHDLHIKHMER